MQKRRKRGKVKEKEWKDSKRRKGEKRKGK